MKTLKIVRPELPNYKFIENKFKKVLSSGLVTNHQKNVQLLENNLHYFLKSKLKPVVFSSGEMALFHLIQAWKIKLKIKENEKVFAIVPSFTFSGTVNALVLNNIEPIFCDIDDTLTVNFAQIKKINNNIKFFIGVSVYGNIPDIKNILKLKSKLVCILDSAPAFGSTYKNKYANEYGIEEIYSFHATKVFTTMEGGCAVSNDKKIQAYLSRLRDFGQIEKKIGNVDLPGLNSKMQEISAIVGNYNLNDFKKKINRRKVIIEKYKKFFLELENRNLLNNMKIKNNYFCIYTYFPIILKNNALQFQKYLKKNKIESRRYYTAVHKLKFYKKKFKCINIDKCQCKIYCREKGLVKTNIISKKIISLPIYSSMSDKEINHLFNVIKKFFKI
jgi:dTDP-4-amino-4,6-dideoxygalactose transaminase